MAVISRFHDSLVTARHVHHLRRCARAGNTTDASTCTTSASGGRTTSAAPRRALGDAPHSAVVDRRPTSASRRAAKDLHRVCLDHRHASLSSHSADTSSSPRRRNEKRCPRSMAASCHTTVIRAHPADQTIVRVRLSRLRSGSRGSRSALLRHGSMRAPCTARFTSLNICHGCHSRVPGTGTAGRHRIRVVISRRFCFVMELSRIACRPDPA